MDRDRRRPARRTVVDRRLRTQLRLFLAIFAVVAVLAGVQVVRDGVDPLWALAGFGVGLALGVGLARAKVLGWDPSEGAVVGTTDAVGAAILVAYLLFLVVRKRLLGGVIHDAATVGVVGLAMTGGTMLGRVASTRRGIRRVLAAAGRGGGEPP
jgi:hypothetical protein